MIWLILVAAVFVVGGAWFVAKSILMRGIVLFAGLAAVGGYMLLGRPMMHDEPLSGRLKEIEEQAKNAPETMTAAQLMALAQERAWVPAHRDDHVARAVRMAVAEEPLVTGHRVEAGDRLRGQPGPQRHNQIIEVERP